MPCALKVILDYLQGALVPSVLVCRCIGLYAMHLRQKVIPQAAALNASPASLSASGFPTPTAMPPQPTPGRGSVGSQEQQSPLRRSAGAWHLAIDLLLLRLRLDTPAQLHRAVCWWLLPWAVYYVIRVGLTPTFRSGAVGCRLDTIDIVIYILGGFIAAVAISVVLLRLWACPDTLFLRCEVAIQLSAWVVFLVVFAYGMTNPAFDMSVVNSTYAIHLGNMVSFLSSVWLPAILSFDDECYRAPPSLAAQLGHYSSGHTSPTTDMASSCVHYTSHARGGADAVSAAGTASFRGVSVVDATENAGRADSVESRLSRAHATNRIHIETTLVTPTTSYESLVGMETVQVALASLPHLFEPAPSEAELVTILQQPAQKTLCDARALRLFAGILLVCESGRHILYRALKREFSAEMLGFMLTCAELRLAARRVIPEAALLSTLTQSRSRRHAALPSVRDSQQRATRSAVSAAVPPASTDETASVFRVVRTDTNASTSDTALSVADIYATLSFLKNHFIAEGAPHQINISAAQVCAGDEGLLSAKSGEILDISNANASIKLQVRALDSAVAELGNIVSSPDSVGGQVEAAFLSALRDVCGAEREVLRLITSGPVYRLVRSPPAFGMAVATLAAELRVDPVASTRSPTHDESGPSSATPYSGIPGQILAEELSVN